MTVAIILVNWNAWQDSIECIDTILGSDSPAFHIYVVDNASSDGSIEKLANWCRQPTSMAGARDIPGVKHHSDGMAVPIAFRIVEDLCAPPSVSEECRVSIVHAGGNLGFAGGNNVGLRLGLQEGCNWFWLLNTDTVIHRDALTQLLRRAQTDDDIGITGATLVYYDEPTTVQALAGKLNRKTTSVAHIGGGMSLTDIPEDPADVEAHMAYVVGASMLVSERYVREIGFMQDDYFLYFEEIDWALRAQDRFRLAWAPRSFVWHKVGRSSAKVMSWFSLRLLYRNRIRFVARFLPERLFATKLHLGMEMLRHALKGRFRQAGLIAETLRDANVLQRSVIDGAFDD